jgi:hypothetical protein
MGDKKSIVRTSFGGEVKPWSSVVDLRHVEEPYRAWVRCFVGRLSQTLFLTHDSPALLPDGSGCWIRMILTVLRQQLSHLCLIHTNLGYGTVLTAACAHLGCSATDCYCCCRCYCYWTPDYLCVHMNYLVCRIIYAQLFLCKCRHTWARLPTFFHACWDGVLG